MTDTTPIRAQLALMIKALALDKFPDGWELIGIGRWDAKSAFLGLLSDAEVIHAKHLPGNDCDLERRYGIYDVTIYDLPGKPGYITATSTHSLARAWLTAILKAMWEMAE